jgi:hypothetical protein
MSQTDAVRAFTLAGALTEDDGRRSVRAMVLLALWSHIWKLWAQAAFWLALAFMVFMIGLGRGE